MLQKLLQAHAAPSPPAELRFCPSSPSFTLTCRVPGRPVPIPGVSPLWGDRVVSPHCSDDPLCIVQHTSSLCPCCQVSAWTSGCCCCCWNGVMLGSYTTLPLPSQRKEIPGPKSTCTYTHIRTTHEEVKISCAPAGLKVHLRNPAALNLRRPSEGREGTGFSDRVLQSCLRLV